MSSPARFISLRRVLAQVAWLVLGFAAVPARAADARPADAPVPELPSAVTRGLLRGVLVPISNVHLSARAAGVIEKFGAEEGQHVEKDDLLVQLNSDIERAELTRAQAVLESSNAEVERTKRELDRTLGLFKSDRIGAQKDVDDATAANAIAVGRRKQAEAELELARARLKERTITATFPGVLFRRTHFVGEAVERLEPVIWLIDATKLEFVIYAGADLMGRFKAGQTVRVTVETGLARGTTITGTVSYVDPTMDPETSTFRVKVGVQPTDNIQSGVSVVLQLPSEVN